MPQKRRAIWSSASEDSSDFDSSLSGNESSHSSPTPIIKSKAQKASDKGKQPQKKSLKKPNRSRDSKRDQCLHVACWIPRAIDMYVVLKDTFRIGMLLEQEESAKDGTLIEDDAAKKERQETLEHVKKDVQERSLRTYKRILTSAPYLRTLVKGNTKKHRKELGHILSEVRKLTLQNWRYAALDAVNHPLTPAIYSDNQRSRAMMGVNHPQLAGMLCPIKHLVAYCKNPKKIQGELQSGHIKMHAAAWPAFAYEGDSPGENFNPLDMQNGLFKGYLMKRVFRHIFKGPSSALANDGEVVTTRSGNAKLHNMLKVDAEHVAYTFVQCRFSISSRDKWQAMDGKYDYHEAYYRIIRAIQEPFDQTWADSLLEWWNMSVFGDKAGIPVFDVSDDDNEEEDDLISMRKQFASREARLKSVSSDAQGSTLPSDPGSDTSVINMASTPATTPPPFEEPAPVPAKAIPKPCPIIPTSQQQVVTPNVDAGAPPRTNPLAPIPSGSGTSDALSHTLPLAPVPSGSGTGTRTSKKRGRTNVMESNDESSLTENDSDVPAPSKRTKKGKGKATTTTTTTSKRKRKGRK
ncbi:uncharacterized protein HD556DRAFT_1437185 [Suillus plorans]|uniref:Uncharacterized protein n=1 Tax=Suillus plorans TaxID=116603 RepID=A0A9P7DWR0_9AGAM|nr:uncharacterized protein HD556DRAFT_1437185 [Suillus plorans]KAG1805027.1 hypothetical protein HD556DRAFT_1437185 [Suillus plorans]